MRALVLVANDEQVGGPQRVHEARRAEEAALERLDHLSGRELPEKRRPARVVRDAA